MTQKQEDKIELYYITEDEYNKKNFGQYVTYYMFIQCLEMQKEGFVFYRSLKEEMCDEYIWIYLPNRQVLSGYDTVCVAVELTSIATHSQTLKRLLSEMRSEIIYN